MPRISEIRQLIFFVYIPISYSSYFSVPRGGTGESPRADYTVYAVKNVYSYTSGIY